MSTCFLDRNLLDKIVRMDREFGGPFGRVFVEHADQQINWTKIPWLYLNAQATRHRAMADYNEPVQEMLWMEEIIHGSQHWMWFGILCHDATILDQTILAYNRIRRGGISYLHRMWVHLKAPELHVLPDGSYDPPSVEAPTSQLKAEFGTLLAADPTPIRDRADYERRMEQIQPQSSLMVGGLQTAFANVPTAPPVVYSWDQCGAFAPS